MKNFRQFEIVIEIARQGSVSKAADALHVSQPTISKLLQKLENELQTELFDRTTLPLMLTSAGKSYVEAGQKILDIQHQLEKGLDRMKDNSANDIHIGISPSRAPYILPELLHRFREKCPEGKIVVKEGNTSQLNDLLMRGELDIIISLLNDSTKGFRCVPLFKETTLLAVPGSLDLTDANEILRTQPFISIGGGLKMAKSLRLILNSIDRPSPQIECTSIESALSLVRKGFGAMIAPSYLAKGHITDQNVKFIPLPETIYKKFSNELERNICMFYRNDSFLSKAEELFMSACNEYAASEK